MRLDRTEKLLKTEKASETEHFPEEQREYRVTLPQVTDLSSQEGIRLEIELTEEGTAEMEVILYPLFIARPEFFPSVRAETAVTGRGRQRVEIPFEQFAFPRMAGAFLKYVDGISVKAVRGAAFLLREIHADIMGDFSVRASGTSRAGHTGEWVEYPLKLMNRRDGRRIVNVRQSLYGKECLPTEYEPYVILEAGEEKEYRVKVKMTEDIPPGGLEKSTFLFVPGGEGSRRRELTFQTLKRRRHPWLFLKEEQWEERRAAIYSRRELYEVFREEYEENARQWQAPEVWQGEDHVYPAYSQNDLFRTAAAWKITGKEAYLQKALTFFRGFLDEEKGYLSTRKSYFEFVESRQEYSRGDFKVCRAQSAGWVQEAEFFNRLAMCYDLLYEHFTSRERERLEKCLNHYMNFVSWRLTEGDGNNFQVAESAAGLLCAMVSENQEMVDRFLTGYNGVLDLLSAVLLDDGMYFEEASGYVKLAGELFFDIINGAENFGISLKDLKVPASFDRNILHAPWSMRETWAEDGKPFLGMSFRRFEKFTSATRCFRDFFDCTARLLTAQGILFSVNDSNEQDFARLYQKAYYLYKDPLYKKIGDLSPVPEILLVGPEEKEYKPGQDSLLMPGAGFGILRDKGEEQTQAVLKFGTHGGYHGHFDRLSLASFLKDGRTFHNNEYAWYGYGSFLFKMWVQTSMAHNMTVADCRMQKPSPCRCVCFIEKEKVLPERADCGAGRCENFFSAVSAETVTEWTDPPYGGQTPYPMVFPEEKCAHEGRFVLLPEKRRKQGAIGEYSEPVFQKRLLILFHGYCIVWDYLEGEREHRYDCLYHPMGRLDLAEDIYAEGWDGGKMNFRKKARFSEDPFGAGQFIMNCYTARAEGTVCLRFRDAGAKGNGNDILDNVPESTLWRVWTRTGEVTVGRYPQRGDSFTEENRKAAEEYLKEPLKKTVAFTVRGKKAEFITILEAGEKAGRIESAESRDFTRMLIKEKDGTRWQIAVSGMAEREGKVQVKIYSKTVSECDGRKG